MGVSALAAHMLVFWYSQSSNISPPVCMAAFAGASIAKSDPMRTGFTALQFSAFLFIIPLLFIYTPIMMPEGLTVQPAQAMVTSFIAVPAAARSEEHTSELQSLIRRSYAFFCLRKNK